MVSEYKRFRDYELMVIFHPELSEEDVAAESDRVQGFLTSADATVKLVNREAPWGRRRLAYPIRHGSRDLRDGNYVLYYFQAETSRIEDVEREIKLDDRIIRYLLTLQSAPIMEPAAPEGEPEVEAEAPVEAATAQQPTAAGSESATKDSAETGANADVTPVPETESLPAVDTEAEAPPTEPAESSAPVEPDTDAPERESVDS